MLEGLLVDLVPFGEEFKTKEHAWRNNEASFWSSGGERHIATQATIQRQFAHWAEQREQRGWLGVNFGIQTKNGLPIGSMGINWLEPTHRLAMLGAKIGEPDYWGGGYGTDALLLIVDYAFDWLDVRKVWLMTTSMNVRVQRQMEKVGFTLEGRQREGTLADGTLHDWLAYSVLNEDWPGRDVLVESLGIRERAAQVYGDVQEQA